jgi:hypothetical protein
MPDLRLTLRRSWRTIVVVVSARNLGCVVSDSRKFQLRA